MMRRAASGFLLFLSLFAQIDKKPEFDQRDRFRSSQVDMAIDSDSHTSGARGATLTGTVNRYLQTPFRGLGPHDEQKLAEVRALLRKQDFGSAATALATASPTLVFHLGRAVTSTGLGNPAEAVAILCAASRTDRDVKTALPFIGDLVELNPGPAVCLRERLGQYSRKNPNDAEGAYVYGLSLLHTDPPDPKLAAATLERASRLKPPSAQVWLELGKLHASAGHNQEAITALENAVALQPGLAQAHYRLAQLYRLNGKSDLASQHLDAWRRSKDSR